jgi:hypothetical protein
MGPETQEIIKDMTAPILKCAIAAAGVAAISTAAKKLAAVNYEEKKLTGNKSLHPTEDTTVLSKSEKLAKSSRNAVQDESVSANRSELKAQSTDAAASDSDAKAMDSGASAAQPKSGALQVYTKGMNIS